MTDSLLLYFIFVSTLALGFMLLTGWVVEWYKRRFR